MNQLEDLIQEISEDLQSQISKNERLNENTRKKLKNIGINPELQIHEIIKMLTETKLNIEELKYYYFGST